MDKSWKALERRIAAQLGTQRTPLSGSNSGHNTDSDTLSEKYYVEVKLRGKLPFYKAFCEAVEKGHKEGKKPILVFHKSDTKRNIVILDLADFIALEKE